MFRKIFFTVLLGLGCAGGAAAQDPQGYDPRLAGSPVYSDPGFQDFVETAYGYLSPASKLKPSSEFRDALSSGPSSAARPAAPEEKYVFVRIFLKGADSAALLGELSASGRFVLSGKRLVRANGRRIMKITGWARAGAVASIRKDPAVAGVYVGRGKGARARRSAARGGAV